MGNTPGPGSAETTKASPWDNAGNPGNVYGLNTIPTAPLKDNNKLGGLSYSLNDGVTTTVTPVYGVTTDVTSEVKGYAVWVYDQQGQYPCYVFGGKPN
jgi:hypothetical protein